MSQNKSNEAIILKIIIQGAFSSGKTSFIEAVSEYGVTSVNVWYPYYNTFLVWDFGLVKGGKDLTILVLGASSTGVMKSEILPILKQSVIGYVLMVDSSDPATFLESQARVRSLDVIKGRPVVVAANKQDKPYAWSPDDLRIALDIPPEIPVVPCVATDKESVKRVLVTLIDEVLKVIIMGKH